MHVQDMDSCACVTASSVVFLEAIVALHSLTEPCYLLACRAVCKELKWPLIDKDDARDCLQAPEDSCVQLDLNQISYNIMFKYCETQLQLGLSAVLDCPLARVALYRQASQLAERVSSREQEHPSASLDSHVHVAV